MNGAAIAVAKDRSEIECLRLPPLSRREVFNRRVTIPDWAVEDCEENCYDDSDYDGRDYDKKDYDNKYYDRRGYDKKDYKDKDYDGTS
jgi:hypothetical protein